MKNIVGNYTPEDLSNLLKIGFDMDLKDNLKEAQVWLENNLTKEQIEIRKKETLQQKQQRLLPIYQMKIGEMLRFEKEESDLNELKTPNFRNYQKAIRESLQLVSEIILVGKHEKYEDFKELIYQIHNIAISYRTDNVEKKCTMQIQMNGELVILTIM